MRDFTSVAQRLLRADSPEQSPPGAGSVASPAAFQDNRSLSWVSQGKSNGGRT